MEEPERKPCPECGKEVTWTKAGKPRKHQCMQKEDSRIDEADNQEQGEKPKVTVDAVIAAYIKTRDEIAAIKKEMEEKIKGLKEVQEKRENWLKGKMDELGLETMSRKGVGTVFIDWKDSATVADKLAFRQWVMEHEEWDFIDWRVSKGAVKQRIEDDGTVPPGVNYTKIKDIKVRRA